MSGTSQWGCFLLLSPFTATSSSSLCQPSPRSAKATRTPGGHEKTPKGLPVRLGRSTGHGGHGLTLSPLSSSPLWPHGTHLRRALLPPPPDTLADTGSGKSPLHWCTAHGGRRATAWRTHQCLQRQAQVTSNSQEARQPLRSPLPQCLRTAPSHPGTGSPSGWLGTLQGKGSGTRRAHSHSAQSHRVGGPAGIHPRLQRAQRKHPTKPHFQGPHSRVNGQRWPAGLSSVTEG